MNVCVVLFVCVCLQLEGYEGGAETQSQTGASSVPRGNC